MTHIIVSINTNHSLGNPNYYYREYNKCNKKAFKKFQNFANQNINSNKQKCFQAIPALGDIDPLWALSHYHYHKRGKQTYRKSILNVLQNQCPAYIQTIENYHNILNMEEDRKEAYKLQYIILSSAYPLEKCTDSKPCFKKIMHHFLSPALNHEFIQNHPLILSTLNDMKDSTETEKTRKNKAINFLNSMLFNKLIKDTNGKYKMKDTMIFNDYPIFPTNLWIIQSGNKISNARRNSIDENRAGRTRLNPEKYAKSVIEDPAVYYLNIYNLFTDIVAKNLYGDYFNDKYNTAEELIAYIKNNGRGYTASGHYVERTTQFYPLSLSHFFSDQYDKYFDPFRKNFTGTLEYFYHLAKKSDAAKEITPGNDWSRRKYRFTKRAIPLFMRSKAVIFLMQEVYKNVPK